MSTPMPQNGDPMVRNLFWALMRFRKVMWQQRPILGCTGGEIGVLFSINHCLKPGGPGVKVSDISKMLHVAPPTVTQILKNLEKRGLVERHVGSTDRRVVRIKLTEQAQLVHQQAHDAYFSGIQELVDHLGEAESDHFVDLLTKVINFYAEKADQEIEFPDREIQLPCGTEVCNQLD